LRHCGSKANLGFLIDSGTYESFDDLRYALSEFESIASGLAVLSGHSVNYGVQVGLVNFNDLWGDGINDDGTLNLITVLHGRNLQGLGAAGLGAAVATRAQTVRPAATGRGTSRSWIEIHNTTATFSQANGITGGHNANAFFSTLTANSARIVNSVPSQSMPGVINVTYRILARGPDGQQIPGVYKAGSFTKTVYNPALLSDTRVANLSARAAQQATFSNGSSQVRVQVDGYTFQVYRNTAGAITNAHLTMSGE
jgi:hypothetical protein